MKRGKKFLEADIRLYELMLRHAYYVSNMGIGDDANMYTEPDPYCRTMPLVGKSRRRFRIAAYAYAHGNRICKENFDIAFERMSHISREEIMYELEKVFL